MPANQVNASDTVYAIPSTTMESIMPWEFTGMAVCFIVAIVVAVIDDIATFKRSGR